jgi:hypothetical protein
MEWSKGLSWKSRVYMCVFWHYIDFELIAKVNEETNFCARQKMDKLRAHNKLSLSSN